MDKKAAHLLRLCEDMVRSVILVAVLLTINAIEGRMVRDALGPTEDARDRCVACTQPYVPCTRHYTRCATAALHRSIIDSRTRTDVALAWQLLARHWGHVDAYNAIQGEVGKTDEVDLKRAASPATPYLSAALSPRWSQALLRALNRDGMIVIIVPAEQVYSPQITDGNQQTSPSTASPPAGVPASS